MKKNRSRIVVYFLAVVLLLLALFVGGRYFVFDKIKKEIAAQVDSLRQRGVEIQFDSLHSNSLSNKIGLRNLEVRFPLKSKLCEESASNHLSIAKIEIEGLSLVSLIFQKKIHMSSLTITKPQATYIKTDHHPKNHPAKKSKIRGILIDEFVVTSASFDAVDSATCSRSIETHLDLALSGLELTDPGQENMTWKITTLLASHIQVTFPKKFYDIKIQNITYHSASKKFRIDSIAVAPQYDKATFARKTGIQTDRISCSIPFVELEGIDLGHTLTPSFHAQHATASFIMDVFRDKRFLSGPGKLRKLPVRFLNDLPIAFLIDSVTLEKSHVAYEEFPETGDTPGKVSFEELTATIYNAGNHLEKNTTMKIRARFMNAGDLQAHLIFPFDPDKAYSVEGSLTNFKLPEINKMLVPIAHAEIKDGFLKAMKFHYQYNDFRSDGELTMDYERLEMVSLVKNSKKDKSNMFLTLILQSFILKKNMTKDERKGTVLFYRSDHKAIFNYWWKSILSGVKSLFNLDRFMEIDGKKKKR
jgi:Domain of Unknown Function (DUF748)